ncbi:zinc finger BED domain-containing protein DAYSLEEPER-like [Senna tora]|uniref:Zinc finger BED domain-containing protein DAYSLEEPER-like n=1 Tax=Senna tora TaxID=362788 RepID=A0A834WCC3_9FABA|nr:zinc finger BED domain-containing protein DAYSLEEPER-like [Senna tora]
MFQSSGGWRPAPFYWVIVLVHYALISVVSIIFMGTTILVFVDFIARSLRLWWGVETAGGLPQSAVLIVQMGFLPVADQEGTAAGALQRNSLPLHNMALVLWYLQDMGVIRVRFVVVKWYLCAERMGLGVRRSLVTWRLVSEVEVGDLASDSPRFVVACPRTGFLDLLGKFLDFLIAVGHPPYGDKAIDEESGMANLLQFLHSSSSSSTVKSELDRYFEKANLPWSPDFDILNWWKINGITYPTIQAIARDFLAILVFTVASE